MTFQGLVKQTNPWMIGGLIAATACIGGLTIYGIGQLSSPQTAGEPTAPAQPQIQQVTALGRLEPTGEVVQLAAPIALDGDRLAKLLVQEGDRVQAGQLIGVLDSLDRLESAVREAQERVRAAQARLSQVRAGAKSGEIQAQQATITRLEADIDGTTSVQAAVIARFQAEVKTTQTEYTRFQRLYTEGAVSASQLDSKRLAANTAAAQLAEAQATQGRSLETLRAQLREARATLSRIAEVRPVDVQAAQVEIDTARAALQQARVNLSQAFIRAPMNAQVLKIHTRPGEKISDKGILDLGQTDAMTVVAEVYQTDIAKIRVGQKALVTGQGFNGQLTGRVSQVGMQIIRQNVFSTEPGENLDRRVMEVRIALSPEDSRRAARLTNMQVDVTIQQ